MSKNQFSQYESCDICKKICKEFEAEAWNTDNTKTFWCKECWEKEECKMEVKNDTNFI